MTIYVNKDNQQFFPFDSKHSTWEEWNGNFIIFYGQMNIPYNDEANWRDTASTIANNIAFSAFPVPTPDRFETWQEWADEVSLIINGKSH